MYFLNANQSAYYICSDFNDWVHAYKCLRHLNTSSQLIFGVTAGCGPTGPKYLVDGVHFNQEGNTKYYNSVCGAVIAVEVELVRVVAIKI